MTNKQKNNNAFTGKKIEKLKHLNGYGNKNSKINVKKRVELSCNNTPYFRYTGPVINWGLYIHRIKYKKGQYIYQAALYDEGTRNVMPFKKKCYDGFLPVAKMFRSQIAKQYAKNIIGDKRGQYIITKWPSPNRTQNNRTVIFKMDNDRGLFKQQCTNHPYKLYGLYNKNNKRVLLGKNGQIGAFEVDRKDCSDSFWTSAYL